jgi:hypothetical protein
VASFEQYLKTAWEPVVKGQWAETLSQGGVWRDVAAAAVTAKAERVDPRRAKLEGGDGLALLAYPSSASTTAGARAARGCRKCRTR